MTNQPTHPKILVGDGNFVYQALDHWHSLPAGVDLVEAVGVATDSQDRVFVFNRGRQAINVFDRDGSHLFGWQAGIFTRPHGITIGPDDFLYLCDDRDHTVHKYTAEGELIWTLGTRGQPSDTGTVGFDFRAIQQAAGPFNQPTNLALANDGSFYISDGYANARVHHFSPEAELIRSWGEPGDGPGQFHLPHGIAVDNQQRVFVADRENSRLQIFSAEGQFLDQWTDVIRPTQVFFDDENHAFVSELGKRAGLSSWMQEDLSVSGGRVSIFDSNGQLLARWGGGETPCECGDFFAPHDLCVDSHGDLYVGEVTMSAGGNEGIVPADCATLQKFVRQ